MIPTTILLLPLCISQPAAEPLAGFKLDGERWSYEGDGLALRGILIKPAGKGPFPAVLISHGLGGSAAAFGMGKAREMARWGLVAIACDYTHAGGPGGKKLDAGGAERQSFGASVENLRRASKCLDILASLPEVDPKKLCAYGHSMGGFVTIGLAAKEPQRLVAAAISGSGIAPREGFPAPSSARAANIKTPFIIFHGSIDNTVRPAQSLALQEILDRNGVACERHVFEGVNHPVDRDKAQEVFSLMRHWFATYKLVEPGAVVAAPAAPASAPTAIAQKAKQRPAVSTGGPPEWIREKIEAKNAQYKTFPSKAIGQEVSYFIYLPAVYERAPETRFPVMYWLHGIGGAQTGVPRLIERFDAAIETGKMPPVLIVFVNGVRNSFYCDSADGKLPVETVIIKDLIPHIDATYRTIAQREARIIEGFSMGGFGAAHLGFKYPELFGAVSIIDGALLDVNSMQTRHADLYERIFGGSEDRFAAENPWTLVEKNADQIRGRTAIRLAVGALVAGNRALHEKLTRRDIDHDYDVFEVGHNHAAIYDSLGEENWKFYRTTVSKLGKGP
jgi:enterochelin esterase-like enzyme/predicted alpha/beta-hydrolase family hydrolase